MTDINRNEASLAHNGLIFWRNWMQTRDVLLSADDAIEHRKSDKIRKLDFFQKERVQQIEALIDKLERFYRGET